MTFRQALNLIYSFDINTPIEVAEKILKFNSDAYNNFLLEVAISLDRKDLFNLCLKRTHNIFGTSLRMCVSYDRLDMLRCILRKRCKECPITVVDYLIKCYYSNPSFERVKNIQECCRFLKDNINIHPMHVQFINTHAMLREKQIKRTLKEFYYAIIEKVLCNPAHPIGKKFILKEYHELFN